MINSAPKRKFAFLVGYLGQNYFGSQINKSLQHEQTVEGRLFLALNNCGYIDERNFEDFNKVKIDRNSRTDKFVNSISTIVTAKMKIGLEENDPFGFKICDKINQQLPEDIRVFSAQVISRRCFIRSETSWREYEYLVPLEEIQFKRDLNEMNEILSDFMGNLSFHSFTPSRKVIYTEDEKGNRFLKDFKKSFSNYRILIKVKAEEIISIKDKDFVRVSIVGLSFIQYQIRKMMGAFILIMQEKIPKDFIKLALHSDLVIATPTACPQLLTKMKCGIKRRKGVMFNYSDEIYEKCLDFKKNYINNNLTIDWTDFYDKHEKWFSLDYELLKERNSLYVKDVEYCSRRTNLPKGFFVYFMIQLNRVDYDLYQYSVLILKEKMEKEEIEWNRDSPYYYQILKEIGFDKILEMGENLEDKISYSEE